MIIIINYMPFLQHLANSDTLPRKMTERHLVQHSGDEEFNVGSFHIIESDLLIILLIK